MDRKRDSPRKLKTIETAIEVIELIQELDGARIPELANKMDLAHSTIHGYLSTLEDNRYLINKSGEYQIGLRFLNIGGYARVKQVGYKYASRKVKELAEETGERAQFVVEEHGKGIYIHTETGNEAIQIDARIGKENHLHASSAGKAILANLPDTYKKQIIEKSDLTRLTDNTIVSQETLYQTLDEVCKRGYAFNREESVTGLRAVGVPVMTSYGDVIGGLSVSGPSNRLQGEFFHKKLPKILLSKEDEIELQLAYE